MTAPIDYCDVLDADPPPRELAVHARRYVRRMSTYIWLVLLILFVTVPMVAAAVFVPRVATIAWGVIAIAATVWLARATARKRANLRRVAIEGRQAPGRIVAAYEMTVRRGLVVGRRVTLVLDVEGTEVTCRSWDGDLEGLERDHWIRVLVHPDCPGVAIPVVNVT